MEKVQGCCHIFLSMQGAFTPTLGKRVGRLSKAVMSLAPWKCRKHFLEYYLQLSGYRGDW